jgi:type I restriction enzyme S subunit
MSIRSETGGTVTELVTSLDELPEGWRIERLGAIAELNPRHPKNVIDRTSVTFLPMPALSESSPDFDRTLIRSLGEVRKGYTHFRDGDVLFAKITPCMENGKGAVATALQNGIGCGTTELHVLRPTRLVDPYYLYRFLQQSSIRELAAANFTGSAGQLRVPASFLTELELPLPPLDEQRRIVSKLEALLAQVTTAQQRLSRIPALLKRFRQSVLAAACSGRLTADWREEQTSIEAAEQLIGKVLVERFELWCKVANAKAKADGRVLSGDTWKQRYTQPITIESSQQFKIPDSWKWCAFDTFAASFQYGPRFGEDEYIQSGVPTVRTSDMNFRGEISLDNPPCVTIPPNSHDHFLLKQDDLVVTRTGATIGKCALYDAEIGPAIASAYLIRYRLTRTTTLPRYLITVLMSPWGQQHLIGGATAVAQPNVNTTTIASIPIPLPPLAEQQEIVRRVKQLFALADRIESRLQAARERVDRLTQALLAKAFRGELVPTEAELARQEGREYESAEELLARFSAVPEAATEKKGRRKG